MSWPRPWGFREATLTHHLNAMEARCLITRTRDTANRRIHMVRLTEAGEAAFLRLQQAAIAFDAGPRAGLADADVDVLTELTAAGAAPDPFRYGPRPDHGGALRADLLLSPYAGLPVDRHCRRQVLLATRAGLGLVSASLGASPAIRGVLALRARTSRYRGLPSSRRPRAVKGIVVTVNPDAVRSLRTACSGQVR